MRLKSGLRKFVLAAHIAVSVGWLGAVVAYVALDVTVATTQDPQTLRAGYLAMGLITWQAIVPLALAALLTGLLISLGTPWGLFRDYWVLISFLLTLLAIAVLLQETAVIGHYADLAANPSMSSDDLHALGNTLPHSVGGTAVLLVITILNIHKPAGLTPYGWRRQQEERLALER